MKYTLGLDIGTTSVGWAVIDEGKQRIHDVGVRIFEKPEDPQSGKSLAEPRRTARSTRRRLKRRRQRLNALKSFFIKSGMLSQNDVDRLLDAKNTMNPYLIREKAISQKVTNDELFIALYHIAKRRGYKSNRKSVEQKDTKSDSSRVLTSISDNTKILHDLQTTSVAVALNTEKKFADHKRNKQDDYTNSFIRQDFEQEAKDILKRQQELGLGLTNEQLEALFFGNEKKGNFNGIFSQRPFITQALIEKMRGKCELEPGEHRAAKASLSFEIFRLAQNLSHLRFVVNGKTRKLTSEEVAQILEKAKSIELVKYKHIREVLGYKNDDTFSFAQGAIRGKVKNDDKSGGEQNKFDELKFFHSVKKALKDSPADWVALQKNQDLFDEIGFILTVNKDDENLFTALDKLKLQNDSVTNLMKLNFSGFGHISQKAVRKITPYLLKGETYDKAMELAGYSFSRSLHGNQIVLPPLSDQESEQITNPVVKRAISQTIKVTNAIIRKYGAPNKIAIEAAGDLAKNFKDRKRIEKLQKENADNNENIKNRLETEFAVPIPSGLQITKFKLYQQQNGKCLYSGKPLNIDRLFSNEHYAEIDHIIPFSRCGNDALNNKVLVLAEENQMKGNLTPYEAWGSDAQRWQDFEALIKATFLPFNKKDRLLTKSKPIEDWNARALNDTRYISKYLRNYIRKNLKFAQFDHDKGKQKVITPSGSITSYLRRVWRVGSKSRLDNNLHHATDAAIIAAISQGTIQRVSRLNKYYELFKGTSQNEIIDKITGEVLKRNELEQHIQDVEPWEDFGKEVRLRTALYASTDQLHNELTGLANYSKEFLQGTTPIFVSRMPMRGGKGATNKETIRSPKLVMEGGGKRLARKQRIPIQSVKLNTLDSSPVKETDPELYKILKDRLQANGDDPQKAFASPVYKPTKSGKPGNLVRGIKVYDTQNSKSGFLINKGRAFVNNGDTVCLNVYTRRNCNKQEEYYFAPVYAHLINSNQIEILPTPKGQSAAEKADIKKITSNEGKVFATEANGFIKQFSVYPNDYIRVKFANKTTEGYYVKYGSASQQVSLISHYSASKDQLITCSPHSAQSIKRYDISILGDNAPRM